MFLTMARKPHPQQGLYMRSCVPVTLSGCDRALLTSSPAAPSNFWQLENICWLFAHGPFVSFVQPPMLAGKPEVAPHCNTSSTPAMRFPTVTKSLVQG